MKQDQKRLSKQAHEQRYVQNQARHNQEVLKTAKAKNTDNAVLRVSKLKRFLAYILSHPKKRRQTK